MKTTPTLALLILIVISTKLFSQNITNTLGTNGSFYVKNGTDTLLRIKQSSGYFGIGLNPTQQFEISKNFKLPLTSDSTKGVIYKGSSKFLHDYAPGNSLGYNTFIGINSGNFSMNATSIYEASLNTGIGNSSLSDLTTGYYNSALGCFSLNKLTSGYSNTATGNGSLQSLTVGSRNTAVGNYALSENVSGFDNTAVGSGAIANSTGGSFNTAIGSGALYNNTGLQNTAVGCNALENSQNANNNTALGTGSLFSVTTGFNNLGLGFQAGYNLVTGNNNIIIGNNAQPSTNSVSNQITLGNSAITSLRCNVQSITSLSDLRDKKNISDLAIGLDFISKLKPRQFNWDKREWYENNISDGSKMENKLNAGFIAQELDEAQQSENADWLGLVNKDNPDKIEATYGNLLPVMVKAIQELKSENDELKNDIEKLNDKIEKLTAKKFHSQNSGLNK